MLAEAASLAGLLPVIRDLGQALVNERDRQKAAAIQVDLTEKVIQAQSQLSQVLGAVIDKDTTIQALSQRIRELEAKQADKARYRLAKMGTLGEFFAYELRPAGELAQDSDEPPHFVCQPCLDAGKKSVLRQTGLYAVCGVCGIKAQILPNPPAAPLPDPTPFDTRY